MNKPRLNAPAILIAALWVVQALWVAPLLRGFGSLGEIVTFLLMFMAVVTLFAVKVAQQWEKAIVLRFGKLHAIRGPGVFLIVPVLDEVTEWIDERIQTTEFNAEQALTKDTVPVNVDAIIFWHVHDAEKRRVGDHELPRGDRSRRPDLAEGNDRDLDAGALLSDRKETDEQLKEEIGRKTATVGCICRFSGNPRCRHSGPAAGCHVAPGAGRTRKASSGHTGFRRSGDRREISSKPPMCMPVIRARCSFGP